MGYAITYTPAFDRISKFLINHGEGSMAFSSLQPNLKFFMDDELGFMPFLRLDHFFWAPKGLNVIIGDPICAPEVFDRLFKNYLKSCGFSSTAFLHLSDYYAKKLASMGYKVNQMGVEHMLHLPDFDVRLPGSKYSHVRRWRNKSQKSGVIVKEQSFGEIPIEHIEHVNACWLESKGGAELIGLNRPLRIEDKKDVRYFWAYHNDKMVGFAFFDPMYLKGKVNGYIHNIARLTPDAPHGTNDLIILEAIRAFKYEGIERFSLGLSPLADVDDRELPHNKNFSSLFKFMYEKCQFVYPFKGNYFHKQKYHADQTKVYVALLPESNPYRLLGVFKALNVF